MTNDQLIRAAAARQGYLGHKLKTQYIMVGAYLATVDGYEPGMPGVFGLCVMGDTEAEALDMLMNEMDEVMADDLCFCATCIGHCDCDDVVTDEWSAVDPMTGIATSGPI